MYTLLKQNNKVQQLYKALMKEKIFIVYQSKDMQNLHNNLTLNEKSGTSLAQSNLQSNYQIK